MEKKLDVFNLTYIRRSAEIEAKKKKEQQPKSWFGGVSSWWSGNKPQDPGIFFQILHLLNIYLKIFFFLELDVEKVMTPQEKQKLYDAIGYEGEDTSTSSYPIEVCFCNSYQFNKIYFAYFSILILI